MLKTYTIREVAKMLNVTQRTVYRWISQGKLNRIKVGGVVRVTEEELERFIGEK